MKNITTSIELKNAIQMIEIEQAFKEQKLIEQFHITYESLKPINIIKSSLNDVASSPYLIENIVGAAIGMATGYITQKVVVGVSGNIIRKVIGAALQFGVTNIVASHPDKILSIGKFIYKYIFRKKS